MAKKRSVRGKPTAGPMGSGPKYGTAEWAAYHSGKTAERRGRAKLRGVPSIGTTAKKAASDTTHRDVARIKRKGY